MSPESFSQRHIGPRPDDTQEMLKTLGVETLDQLLDQTLPASIRMPAPLNLGEGLSEAAFLQRMRELASKNKVLKTYIGMGYYGTHTPSVILRNVLVNPVWYTSYTPYQAEISQGRLEALLNFQTMVCELTGMPLANASLLDEATTAAEAMILMFNTRNKVQQTAGIDTLLVQASVWPQTRAVLETRALGLGIRLEFVAEADLNFEKDRHFGLLLQYPDARGCLDDRRALVELVHGAGGKVAVATDLLALTLIQPPGEWGADIVVGSTQRMGVPMAYGGPHAAFFAVREELKRQLPGRIIGVSRDVHGKPALRMALQTREQHIKREKATSNICTAQALLATMAGFYAVYHGPDGLRSMAARIHAFAGSLSEALEQIGLTRLNPVFFDTLHYRLPKGPSTEKLRSMALSRGINLLYTGVSQFGISLDETTTAQDVKDLLTLVADCIGAEQPQLELRNQLKLPANLLRKTKFMQQEVFLRYRSETEMMRYIKRLERKDISLAHSMISLGSCTMKLNAASELLPLGMAGLQRMHPFAPVEQAEGYRQIIDELEEMLAEITGFAATSLQPNSGAAGEYTGLITIASYLESKGEEHRNIVLIPASAHGTNPASAVQAGFTPVTVLSDVKGNVDMDDLRLKIDQHRDNLAAFMITYPSTHGIFEVEIKEMCRLIHEAGGQVYMDGANMNAQVGYTNPGTIGADVCHLNLHKTFAIPHGGGGPGVGPICVAEHLVPFLPGHPVTFSTDVNTVSSAAYGSAGVLEITYAYIRMMGAQGLKEATAVAILSANYLAEKLDDSYGIVYRGSEGRVGHELILDCRGLKDVSGITETDIAKRLIDYGYHAPTLSFPVHGTLMVEPTESESLAELDRFVDAMIEIHEEIIEVSRGEYSKEDNVLVNAPHPEYEITADEWTHSYTRSKAAYPLPYVRENKFWVNVARVDNAFGDRNLVSSLPATDEN